jgi:hypothetical protein
VGHLLGILFFVAVMVFAVLCMTGAIPIHNANTGQVVHQTLTRVVFGVIYLVIGLGGAGGMAVALLGGRHTPIPAQRTSPESAEAGVEVPDHTWDAFH